MACSTSSLINSKPFDDDSLETKMATGTGNRGKSTIVTTTPYEPSYKNRKRGNTKLNPTFVHFDHLFGTDNWSRFLVLKTERRISSSVLENKLLSLCPTREMCFRALKMNEWLIEATTKTQSNMFQNMTEIQGIKVQVECHDMLNFVQGTVVLPQIDDEEELPEKNTLLESLKLRYTNIHDLEVYQIPSRKDQNITIKIAKIKFTGQDLPLKIKILGQNREVRPHVPKPLQCKSCCKFGHTHKKCKNKEICAVCGSEEHATNWKCPNTKCCNCGLPHHAKSKECAFHIYNTELKLLMSRTGMAAKEAKLELKVRGIQDPGRNPLYKNVLKSKVPEIPNANMIAKDKDKIRPHIIRSNSIVNTNPYETLVDIDLDCDNPIIDEPDEDISNAPKPQRSKETKKRNLERTPPKNKKPNVPDLAKVEPSGITITNPSSMVEQTNDNSRIVKMSEAVDEQSENLNHVKNKYEDEITPSPVFPCKTKISNSKTLSKRHADNCGCHSCFMDTCDKIENKTRETLINAIRNFLKFKSKETTNMELHETGCLCINHLILYKEKHIPILDKLIENLDAKDPKHKISEIQTSSKELEENTRSTPSHKH